jgi:hypothetical protein
VHISLYAKLFYSYDFQFIDFNAGELGIFRSMNRGLAHDSNAEILKAVDMYCRHLRYVCDGLVYGLGKSAVVVKSFRVRNYMFVTKALNVLKRAIGSVEVLCLEQRRMMYRYRNLKWENHLHGYAKLLKKAKNLREVDFSCPRDINDGAERFLRECVNHAGVKKVSFSVLFSHCRLAC